MHFLNTLSNSFVLGEKNDKGVVTKQLGFPKGGLTYLIENNNVKFFLKEDYFYRNLVFSADAPLLIDGVLVPINSIPAALTKIFHMEAEGSVVDTDFNTESFNAIANSPVSIRFNEIEALQGTISGEVDTLSGAMETKADRSEIPDVSNFIEMSDVEAYTYDKQTIDTKIENVEVDAYTKQESDARFQPIGDYLTKASGDTIYQPIGDYATRSEIPSVVGYADSVKYNSTTKYVEFYHGGTGGTKVFEYDAAPFLIDGMVQNVEIINGNLVISFNTDAGKQDITIPLTDIFDPSNYYNKTEVNEAIDGVKAYFIDLDAIMIRGGLTDSDWDGAIAAVNAHRPVYIKFYNNHYILESYSLDNNTMYLSASDGEAASRFTITKNGSNDYSLNRAIRSFVTDAEIAAWNNKSDFSGDYNDLTNKPTIPTVPSNVSAFNNDAGYITSGDAASQIEEAVSGKVNTSTYNAYTAATDVRLDDIDNAKAYYINFMTIDSMMDEDWNGIVAAIDDHRPIYAGYLMGGTMRYYGVEYMNKNSGNTEIVMAVSDNSQHYFYTLTKNGSNDYSVTFETREYVSQAEKATWNAKQNALSAGTGIEISGNVISATGGGVTVDSTLDSGSTNPVANSAITAALDEKQDISKIPNAIYSSSMAYGSNRYIAFTKMDKRTGAASTDLLSFARINDNGLVGSNDVFYLVETSAITSAITSASTNAEVAGAKAVYDQLGGLKLVKLSQQEYDNLSTKDNSTLYVIVD